MASEDVGSFLASVGSPLVEHVQAPVKQLPASAVLKLLDARIDAHTAHDAAEESDAAVESDEVRCREQSR